MRLLITGTGGFLGLTLCRLGEAGLGGRGVSTLLGTLHSHRPALDRTILFSCDSTSADAV